jgi:hypothetical protein
MTSSAWGREVLTEDDADVSLKQRHVYNVAKGIGQYASTLLQARRIERAANR